jgi:DNA-binding XRE family transcriptional regulator
MTMKPAKHRTLKGYRRTARLTQREAARVFAITQAEWCRFENGERTPNPKLALRISKKSGIPLATLLGL